MKEKSKLISKEIRAIAKARRSARVQQVLEDFKDLRRLENIRGGNKKRCMGAVIDKHGVEKTDANDIAEVFADFFESLYQGESREFEWQGKMHKVKEVTVDEIRRSLQKMKPRKAADDQGIIAELMAHGSDRLLETLASLFTSILKPDSVVPEYWKASSIRILFKKGDERQPENYRPICIVPILYKLFSRVLCGRIDKSLNEEQSNEQAGFRTNFSCDDHLFAMTILAEKCNEFNMPLWVATLDFRKAFDSINHDQIWRSLIAHGVEPVYVHTLSKLYQGQRACIQSDAQSRYFPIMKGTKQGDPISPIVFNSVLEEVMRDVKTEWSRKRYGLQLGHGGETLTNLRFADDIVIIARTLPQIKQMIADVAAASAKTGLKLHPEKTKIQHNNIGYGSRVRSANVSDMHIQVLSSKESAMYLGRLLSLTDTHDVELDYRIKKGWAKFGMLKQELTDKTVPLHLRLKLFHSVVTPTVLYGCGSWVMTTARDDLLRSTQMKMLRRMLGRARKVDASTDELETWVEWVQRVTHEAREQMMRHHVTDWVDEQRKRAVDWRYKLVNMDSKRWAKQVLEWFPTGCRSRGHPRTRWIDQVSSLSP